MNHLGNGATMSEFFQFLAVLLLFLIWVRLAKIIAKIIYAGHSVLTNEKLIEIAERVESIEHRQIEIAGWIESIEERLSDNFQTDEERQHAADREP
jgi:hypothetical protein